MRAGSAQLLEPEPRVVGVHPDDDGAEQSGCAAEGTDVRTGPGDGLLDVVLELVLVGVVVVEEELIVFVAGHGGVISEQGKEGGSDNPPDGKDSDVTHGDASLKSEVAADPAPVRYRQKQERPSGEIVLPS